MNCLEILPQNCMFYHASWKVNCFVPLLTAIHTRNSVNSKLQLPNFCTFPSQFNKNKMDSWNHYNLKQPGKYVGETDGKMEEGRKMHQDTYNKNISSLKFTASVPIDGEGCSSWDKWHGVNLKSVCSVCYIMPRFQIYINGPRISVLMPPVQKPWNH